MKSNADEARTAARRFRAMEMRKAGASYRQIAADTGVTIRTAWRDVQRELATLVAETRQTTEAWRTMELQRLDRLQLAHWTRALGYKDKDEQEHPPDKRSAEVVLRIMERRARLLGLDAPQQVEVAAMVTDVTSDEMRERVREKLARLADGLPVIEVQPVVPQLGEGGGNGHGPRTTST